LSGLADWEWFVTMTLRDPPPSGRTWTKPGWASAKRAWVEFENRARPALGELTTVRMFELTRDRGVPHIHALVADTDPSVRRMEMVDWAWDRWGIARVLKYQRKKGAAFYLSKYISKDIADIQFSRGVDKAVTACYS